MKRFNGVKGFVCGLLVGGIGITSVFAASGIKSADFNSNIVIFDGKQLELSQPMISVVKEGEYNASNYMPVRAVLEAMGYTIDWDGSRNAVIVNLPKSEMVYYDEFPTVPDFSWVVRDYVNISHTREYWDKEFTNGWGVNPTVGYYYNLYETLNTDFRKILDLMWNNQQDNYIDDIVEFLSEYEDMYNLYIQTLIKEGFKESKNVKAFSKFQAGYGITKAFEKDNVRMLLSCVWNGHGKIGPLVYIEIESN